MFEILLEGIVVFFEILLRGTLVFLKILLGGTLLSGRKYGPVVFQCILAKNAILGKK